MKTLSYLLSALLVFWAALELRHARLRAAGRPEAKVDDRRTLEALFGVIVPAELLALGISLFSPTMFPPAATVAGLVLAVLGLALREWSVVTLGRFFTVDVAVQKGHAVVDRGPYRLVRHPAYSGALLAMFGFGLAFGNWFSLALAFIPGLALLLWRIKVEEEVLIRELGEPYRAYTARVKRLVPFLY